MEEYYNSPQIQFRQDTLKFCLYQLALTNEDCQHVYQVIIRLLNNMKDITNLSFQNQRALQGDSEDSDLSELPIPTDLIADRIEYYCCQMYLIEQSI